MLKTICAAALLTAFPMIVSADIEVARDLMEEGKFEQARDALWPAARSGNADAEELIGVMYAMGLGVEQDYERAFDWYLRSAMKGHPGAQSGVGWYYEVGLGMACPRSDAGLYVVCFVHDRRRPRCGDQSGRSD